MNEPIYAKEGIDPYATCGGCVVKNWCKRRSGEVALPSDYALSDECGGYIMLEQALKLSGIPKEYRNANRSSFVLDGDNQSHSTFILAALERPADMVNKGINLAFISPYTGTGKTYTSCAIANEYIYKTCVNPDIFDYETPLAMYVKFGDWSNEIRRAHQENDSELFRQMYDNIDNMKNVPLLVLDDIGSGRITDVIRDLTYDVIDKRKEEQRSTIYSSNLSTDTLSGDSYLGARIVSRILYKSSIISLGGRDRRLRK